MTDLLKLCNSMPEIESDRPLSEGFDLPDLTRRAYADRSVTHSVLASRPGRQLSFMERERTD
jgi:hypothetical protein